jgi:hypothetical protein
MATDTTIRDAWAIAEATYVLAAPLVVSRRAMAQATAVAEPEPETLRAPVNSLVIARDTPDTVRASGWLDLAREPIVLTVPPTCGRYYALWLRDAFGAVFASLGPRTTGTARGAFAVLGPRHHGLDLPLGLTAVAAPTRTVRVGGHLEAVGEPDDEALPRARDGFRLTPLSRWSSSRTSVPIPSAATGHAVAPAANIERMGAAEFFAEVLRLVEDDPPDLAGRVVLNGLRDLGAGASLSPDLSASLERGLAQGRSAVAAALRETSATGSGGWVTSGLTAGQAADPAHDALHARFDTDGDERPLSGDDRYVLCFAPDAPPPVRGFWELTSGTHSIGDLHGLALAPNGSLTVHIQHVPPARERRSNWLPTPRGRFTIALHLYWPREEALVGTWSPPPVRRVG